MESCYYDRKEGDKLRIVYIIGALVLLLIGSMIGFLSFQHRSGAFVGGVISLYVISMMYLIVQKRKKTVRRWPSWYTIDRMNGLTFEHFLKDVLEEQGYSVEVTKGSGDYGADLLMKKRRRTIVVQVKRYRNNVGLQAVQEVIGAQNMYRTKEAWVITNSYYTKPAKELARVSNVQLYDRDDLARWLHKEKEPTSR